MRHIVTFGDIAVGGENPFVLIAGPCQLENLEHARMLCGGILEGILEACAPTGTRCIFKASFDKANRSSIATQRGFGIEKGLDVLARIREEFCVPVLTDVHEPWHCDKVAQVVDILVG